jgi:hypothetical protein
MTEQEFPQSPLKLSMGQIALKCIAIEQIRELNLTVLRLLAITSEQADQEVLDDIPSDTNNHIKLLLKWFGTHPMDADFMGDPE